MLRERAGVHVAVPTHSLSATFTFLLMDETLEHDMQATYKKGTSLYGENWKIVDNIDMMAWIGIQRKRSWQTRMTAKLMITDLLV